MPATTTRRPGRTIPKAHAWDGFDVGQDKRLHWASCVYCGEVIEVIRKRWSSTTFARALARHDCAWTHTLYAEEKENKNS